MNLRLLLKQPVMTIGGRGYSLVELLIVVAIVLTTGSILVPMLQETADDARDTSVISDLEWIAGLLLAHEVEFGQLPNSLSEILNPVPRDPWGNEYRYTRIRGADPDKVRKDRFQHPISSDFDLWSNGPDGDFNYSLTAHASRDDIIRADDGGYYGVAEDY